jgi:replicative DNA helicase
MLTSRNTIATVADIVTGPEFYRPAHELIYDAILRLHLEGEPADPITVADHLTTTKDLHRAGGASYLHELVASCPLTSNADYYAAIVAEHAARRRLVETGHRITQLGYQATSDDLLDLYTSARDTLEKAATWLPTTTLQDIPGQTIDELLAGDDPEYDWLIPGFLERRDRLILTAGEGHGKSTLMRQLAIQAAAGIHPWNADTTTPIKVLLIDLENSRRQSRRKLRPLRLQAGARLDPTNLIIECKNDGLDLTAKADQAWLDQVIRHHRPDLLITGPIYKMANGNPNDEVDVKPIAMCLDRLRVEHDIAVLLEAHSKKGDGGKHRPKEPFGWSGWMRWPEFGLHLAEDGEITHWRGARDERAIPHQLNRGGAWPWTPATSVADQRWVQIRDFIRATGRKPTYREIRDATGIRMEAISAVMNEHTADLASLYYSLGEDA